MRIAVLVSGNGTNLQALLDAQGAGKLRPAEIALVISNRPQAPALQRAKKAGVPQRVVDHKNFSSRAHFEEALIAELQAVEIEAVVLAGFMRILSPLFVEHFQGRILNTHPALCPSFPGIDAPQQAIDAGVKITGCTVHLVDTGVDTGPIVLQEALAVEEGDSAESLHRRIQVLEHRLLPEATRMLAEGRIELDKNRVRIKV
jgi:phosphoribosylglycinamide formyltransferase-1